MVASFIARMRLREPAVEDTTVADEVERLVREHARFVFRVAHSVLRNHHDAEDAAQETFVRLLRQSHRLAEIEDVRAWIGTIAFRVAVERRREPVAVDLEIAGDRLGALSSGEASVEHDLQRAQLSALLWSTIETLPVELRDALKLSTVTELTSAQAGAVLGVPEGTVRNRVHRAKQLLQQKLTARLRPSTG